MARRRTWCSRDHPEGKPPPFFSAFLCMFVLSMSIVLNENGFNKGVFRTQARHEAGSVRSFVRIMPVHPFSPQLFLCLSRACLGKKMVFSMKWHRKKRVSVPHPGLRRRRLETLSGPSGEHRVDSFFAGTFRRCDGPHLPTEETIVKQA